MSEREALEVIRTLATLQSPRSKANAPSILHVIAGIASDALAGTDNRNTPEDPKRGEE